MSDRILIVDDEGMIARAMASFVAGEPILLTPGKAGDEFDIQWMPPGPQDIICHINDEPGEMKFVVKAKHAEILNTKLQDLIVQAKAGEGDIPFIDFNHEDGAASGHPKQMYWGGEDKKKGGIRLRGPWTGSGKQAVVNGDFTRFSPLWDFNKQTMEPVGIGVNLGGLVNRAAFRSIATVAAKAAANNNKGKEMDRKEFQELLAEGLKPITDRITTLEAKASDASKGAGATATAAAGAVDEGKIVQLITTALKPVTDKIKEFETAQAGTATAAAKAAVQAHVQRGAIAPEDTETIGIYTDAYLKDAVKAEKAMAKLPGKRFQVIAGAGGSMDATAGGEPEEQFLAKAKAFATANKITGGDAEIMTAYARTAEGNALYGQFRSKIVRK